MLYLDVKYLKQVSYRLLLFKTQKETGNTYQAVCRCPICGDSQKNPRKTRGYFYSFKDHLMYKCHNCNASLHFGQFLKDFDYPVWQEYKLEIFKHNKEMNPAPKIERVENLPDVLQGLQSIESLEIDHPAKQYVIDRKIPEKFWNILFYTDKFYEWTHKHTDKFKEMHSNDHPRLIIPWYDKDGRVFTYHARALGDEQPKYFSVVLDKSVPRVYGIERIDWSKPINCVEGPIDSLFLPNCVAVGTSALYMFQTDDQEVHYISDNENRNKEILKVYAKLIKLGKTLFIPPDNYEHKDINVAVINNFDILSCINDNLYNGLRAQARLAEWKRVDYD